MRQKLADTRGLKVNGQLDRRLRHAALRLSQDDVFDEGFVLQDIVRLPGYHRQFEEWAGDFSGRYIGALSAYARYTGEQLSRLHSVARAMPRYQRASGLVGSDMPAEAVDFRVIWGQGRLLAGLLEYHAAFPSDDILGCARRLGDHYVANRSYWRTPETCAQPEFPFYTQAIQPLVALYAATGQQSYLDVASEMGMLWLTTRAQRSGGRSETGSRSLGPDFSGQHSHATLLTLLGLLELFEATDQVLFLQTASDLAGQIHARMTFFDGAPPEFFPWSARNEGCSIADWLELNLRLGLITEQAQYFEVAERVWRNGLYSNQGANGGFGHRNFSVDRRGYTGDGVEAWWCCSCHGLRGYCRLLPYLYTSADDEVHVQFFEPSTIELTLAQGRLRIAQETEYPGRGETTLHILEAPPNSIRLHLRVALWATGARVLLNGVPLPHSTDASYLRTSHRFAAGDRVTLVFPAGLRLESGKQSRATIWYGPLLMTSQMPGGMATALAVPAAEPEGQIRLPPVEPTRSQYSIVGTEFSVIGTGHSVPNPVESLALNQPQFGRLRPLSEQTAFASPPPTILEHPVIVAEAPAIESELMQLLGGPRG